MKKFVPPTVIALVLTALIVFPLPAANAQAGLVSSILSKMEKNRQNLRSLSADISMEKYNSQLGESEKYFGTIRYIPAGRGAALVRLDWNKPQQEILVVANGGYILYRPRLKQARIGNTNSVRSAEDKEGLGLLH